MRTKSTVEILANSSKVKERDQSRRKKLIDLTAFVHAISAWQLDRPPLHLADQNNELLIFLFLGEVDEIEEQREQEGLLDYDFKSEKGEVIDAGFFLASHSSLLQAKGGAIDYREIVERANGQASGSKAIKLLREVGGNITEKSLQKDLQYLWTIWVSYLLHMKHPVDPNRVLAEYTFPKNNGNYVLELLRDNPVFRQAHGREMDEDEQLAYFAHYRKIMRLIRDFVIEHVDPTIEHTGLKPEHYIPYKAYIYGFEVSRSFQMCEAQLYADYNVPRVVYKGR